MIKPTLGIVAGMMMVSCAFAHRVCYQLHPVYSNKTVQLTTVPFNKVHVNGNFDVKVYTGSSKNTVRLKPENHTLNGLQMQVDDYVLYLRMPPMFAANGRRVTVTINMPHLQDVQAQGHTQINLPQNKTYRLAINNQSSGDIKINGHVDLTRLTVSGSGDVAIRWVDSPKLVLRGFGSGKMQLAGVVDTLDAKMFNQSRLYGRYLRAKTAYIRTTQNAFASITPVNTLRAFAVDTSNIYFYKMPEHLSRYAQDSGNVLQLAWDN